MTDDSVLEARIPELNPWEGVRVLGLHSHPAEQKCDDRCTVYDRTSPKDTTPKAGER
jgi:hypothetical protein